MFNSYKLVSFLIALTLCFSFPAEKPIDIEEVVGVANVEEESEPQVLDDPRILVGEGTITHYCICEKCCGKKPDHPAYGITASGRKAVAGVSVAVDKSIIPLGSEVIIDYGNGDIRHYRADDTGSAIKGNRIDVCVEDHQLALELGKKTATIYYIPNVKE
ncbi:MAG: 3D domain-containing protein [Paludibacteraceae bacterium]|nr:3D domain-containing protein [Paludibacteraceae bacterium]